METVLKLKPAELNTGLITALKLLFGKSNAIEITISMKSKEKNNARNDELGEGYKKRLNKAIENIEHNRNLVSFTGEEFEMLTGKLLSK